MSQAVSWPYPSVSMVTVRATHLDSTVAQELSSKLLGWRSGPPQMPPRGDPKDEPPCTGTPPSLGKGSWLAASGPCSSVRLPCAAWLT
eukprot:scaffold2284_cov402-Prasinococcus_capsulatus_cf.AAC.1